MKKLRLRHGVALVTLVPIFLSVMWFALAYGGLPRLWSRHEHKLMPSRHALVSYTAQDIPGDPVDLEIFGSEDKIVRAFSHANWSRADAVSFQSAMQIATSVAFGKPYPQAPVSPLYVADKVEDLAFQLDDGRSAARRHHVRFWRIGSEHWLAAASFDRGVGLSFFTLQITHHIGPDVDKERDAVGTVLANSGWAYTGISRSGLLAGRWLRNGGGDRYRTDGAIKIFTEAHPSKS